MLDERKRPLKPFSSQPRKGDDWREVVAGMAVVAILVSAIGSAIYWVIPEQASLDATAQRYAAWTKSCHDRGRVLAYTRGGPICIAAEDVYVAR